MDPVYYDLSFSGGAYYPNMKNIEPGESIEFPLNLESYLDQSVGRSQKWKKSYKQELFFFTVIGGKEYNVKFRNRNTQPTTTRNLLFE